MGTIRKPTLKDLRTTLNVLATLDIEVPNHLLVELSERIRQKEKDKLSRKINRMSEEELIRFGNRQKSTLRIILNDGRLIQSRTNETSFLLAIKEAGYEHLQGFEMKVRRNPVFLFDPTCKRQRIKNYALLSPGLFVYTKTTAAEKKKILVTIAEKLLLEWEISVI